MFVFCIHQCQSTKPQLLKKCVVFVFGFLVEIQKLTLNFSDIPMNSKLRTTLLFIHHGC